MGTQRFDGITTIFLAGLMNFLLYFQEYGGQYTLNIPQFHSNVRYGIKYHMSPRSRRADGITTLLLAGMLDFCRILD